MIHRAVRFGLAGVLSVNASAPRPRNPGAWLAVVVKHRVHRHALYGVPEWAAHYSPSLAELDEFTRMQQCQRTIAELEELQWRLALPLTRYRKRADVEHAGKALIGVFQADQGAKGRGETSQVPPSR